MSDIKIKSILIVKLDHIGDMILTTPIFKSIKEKYPDCMLGVLCSTQGSLILRNNPYVDRVHFYNPDMFDRNNVNNKQSKLKDFMNVVEVRRLEYDVCIGLREDLNNIVIQDMLAAKFNISFSADSSFREIVDKEVLCDGNIHAAYKNYYLLDLINIVRPMYPQPQLFPDEKDEAWVDSFLAQNRVIQEDIIIGISPGGGWYLNWWPWENYADLCDKISKHYKNIKIVLIGGKAEEEITEKIKERSKVNFIDAVGKTSLQQLGALYKRMKIVICNDGGTMHVATSVGVPVIAMFGPSPERFYPLGKKNEIVNKHFPCSPCPQFVKGKPPKCQDNRCMKAIKVEEIYKIVTKKMEELNIV